MFSLYSYGISVFAIERVDVNNLAREAIIVASNVVFICVLYASYLSSKKEINNQET